MKRYDVDEIPTLSAARRIQFNQPVGSPRSHEAPILDESLNDLLDEEGVSSRSLADEVGQSLHRGVRSHEVAEQRADRLGAERRKRQLLVVRSLHPACVVLGPEVHEEQAPRRRGRFHEHLKWVQHELPAVLRWNCDRTVAANTACVRTDECAGVGIHRDVRLGQQHPVPAWTTLSSETYTNDFNAVKALGRNTGSTRTEEQTALALFWDGNASIHWNQIDYNEDRPHDSLGRCPPRLSNRGLQPRRSPVMRGLLHRQNR
jgi:hypothetical protein